MFNLETFFNLVYYLIFFNRFNVGVLFSNLLLTKNVGVLLVDYLNQKDYYASMLKKNRERGRGLRILHTILKLIGSILHTILNFYKLSDASHGLVTIMSASCKIVGIN